MNNLSLNRLNRHYRKNECFKIHFKNHFYIITKYENNAHKRILANYFIRSKYVKIVNN